SSSFRYWPEILAHQYDRRCHVWKCILPNKMRKVTFGGASSLDNFIARNDDSVDWLKWNREVDEIFAKYWQTVDTVVMGRRTYEVAARMGSGAYPGVKNYVCSRMLV